MKRFWLPAVVPVIFLACSLAYLVPSLFLNSRPYYPGLDYYVQAQRLDPIFAIEGTDPAKLTDATQALVAQKDRLMSVYGAKNSAIAQNTYPTAFLTTLPKLEEARQALLAGPTPERARKYHDLLLLTSTEYAADARALAASLRDAGTQMPSIGYLGGKASIDDMAAKLDMVASVALKQKKKEAARFACIQRPSTRCTPLAELASMRDASLQAPAVLPAPEPDVHKADTLVRQVLHSYTNLNAISENIFTIPSNCYLEPVAHERVYYLAPYEGAQARKLAYSNDAYFYDMPRIEKARPISIYKAFLAAGVTVNYQNVGNLYECPDSGLDVVQVGSLLGVLDALEKKESKTPDEQKLLALPAVQKADLAPYVQAAAKLNTPQGDGIVGRYLQGSADFDQVVLGAHNDNLFLLTWEQEPAQVSFEFLLIARNFASTLFLLGNPTFMPSPVSLFTDNTPALPSKLYLREYLSDVSREYTDEQILAQTKSAADVYARFKILSR